VKLKKERQNFSKAKLTIITESICHYLKEKKLFQ
jgi:hypothetical protein